MYLAFGDNSAIVSHLRRKPRKPSSHTLGSSAAGINPFHLLAPRYSSSLDSAAAAAAARGSAAACCCCFWSMPSSVDLRAVVWTATDTEKRMRHHLENQDVGRQVTE